MKLIYLFFALSILRVAADEPAPAKLPEGTKQVALVLYDYLVDQDHPRIETDGKMHPGVISAYTKILSDPQIDRVLKALTQNHDQSDRYMCDFAPHHGIVFRNEDGKILGSVSICFHCKELHSETFPRIGSPLYSYWGWPELRAIFKDAGLPILDSDEDYTAIGKSISEKDGADHPAIAPESKSEGNEKPKSERKVAPR